MADGSERGDGDPKGDAPTRAIDLRSLAPTQAVDPRGLAPTQEVSPDELLEPTAPAGDFYLRAPRAPRPELPPTRDVDPALLAPETRAGGHRAAPVAAAPVPRTRSVPGAPVGQLAPASPHRTALPIRPIAIGLGCAFTVFGLVAASLGTWLVFRPDASTDAEVGSVPPPSGPPQTRNPMHEGERWTGSITCPDHTIPLVIEVEQARSGRTSASVSIVEDRESWAWPAWGLYESVPHTLDLRPIGPANQPHRYILAGRFSDADATFAGRTWDPDCTRFSVSRAPSPRLAPAPAAPGAPATMRAGQLWLGHLVCDRDAGLLHLRVLSVTRETVVAEIRANRGAGRRRFRARGAIQPGAQLRLLPFQGADGFTLRGAIVGQSYRGVPILADCAAFDLTLQ